MMRSRVVEAIISGTVGAIAMLPVGLVFRALEMRVGHYGPKFAEIYLTSPGPALLFSQHIVIGWISAAPLVLLRWHAASRRRFLFIGLVYGALYYLAINALALPLYFSDSLPWTLGWKVVLPSLVVHLVFGVAVAYSIQRSRTSNCST
jgi:uncharacterized membrane protein YagU involved in acid resistance